MLRSLMGGGAKHVAPAALGAGPALLALGAFLVGASSLPAAIFPDQIGEFTKGAPKALAVPDQALYDEYGLTATEQAEYSVADGSKHLTATVWRLRDST